jgi:hypothetical protein
MASTKQTQFTLTAQGHANIQGTHSSTFEVTMDSQISTRGDCIIGVNASHGARNINTLIGDAIRRPHTRILTILSDGKITDQVHGYGSPQCSLTSPSSLVWRTSDFVNERTLSIRCNKAAHDLNRQLIKSLQNPNTTLQVALVVLAGDK